ncbi:hypothetical protein [Clostridium oceanicum]|uniref:Protein TolB n=1 Tax=Clostridium oceanicum TaxID=1543 RepID=A0ABP3UMP2_9CLOT
MKGKLKIRAILTMIPVVLIGTTYIVNSYLKDYTDYLNENNVVVTEKSMASKITENKPLEIVQKRENIKGINHVLGVISEDELLINLGITKDEYMKKYKDKDITDMNPKEYEQAQNDVDGKVYKLNFKTLEKSPLKNKNQDINNYNLHTYISPDYSKLYYNSAYYTGIDSKGKNGKILNFDYIYNLKDNTSVSVDKKIIGNWSKDGKYLIGKKNWLDGDVSKDEYKKIREKTKHTLYLYDIKNKNTKEINIDPNVVSTVEYGYYYKYGKEIYFGGVKVNKENEKSERQGIFKVNIETKKVDEVMILPNDTKLNPSENYIGFQNYKFINGRKNIIFNGNVDGKDGIFNYDIEKNKFTNLIPNVGIETEIRGAPSFWISPDKTKIAYLTQSKEKHFSRKHNLYVARINDNNIINRILLKEKIYIGNTKDSVQWSRDGNTMSYVIINPDSIGTNTVNGNNSLNVVKFKK